MNTQRYTDKVKQIVQDALAENILAGLIEDDGLVRVDVKEDVISVHGQPRDATLH